jgi:outer membrane protein TolC
VSAVGQESTERRQYRTAGAVRAKLARILIATRSRISLYSSGMTGRETRLEIAKQHVAEARKVVEQQKQLIERRKASKLETTSAEALLRNFERTLADFEDHLAGIEAKKKRKP